MVSWFVNCCRGVFLFNIFLVDYDIDSELSDEFEYEFGVEDIDSMVLFLLFLECFYFFWLGSLGWCNWCNRILV